MRSYKIRKREIVKKLFNIILIFLRKIFLQYFSFILSVRLDILRHQDMIANEDIRIGSNSYEKSENALALY